MKINVKNYELTKSACAAKAAETAAREILALIGEDQRAGMHIDWDHNAGGVDICGDAFDFCTTEQDVLEVIEHEITIALEADDDNDRDDYDSDAAVEYWYGAMGSKGVQAELIGEAAALLMSARPTADNVREAAAKIAEASSEELEWGDNELYAELSYYADGIVAEMGRSIADEREASGRQIDYICAMQS